jgi:hypothetical protein
MSGEGIEHLIDRWLNEPDFRARLRADPEGTVRDSGVELDADEWEALRGIDQGLPDQELQTRVSRGG